MATLLKSKGGLAPPGGMLLMSPWIDLSDDARFAEQYAPEHGGLERYGRCDYLPIIWVRPPRRSSLIPLMICCEMYAVHAHVYPLASHIYSHMYSHSRLVHAHVHLSPLASHIHILWQLKQCAYAYANAEQRKQALVSPAYATHDDLAVLGQKTTGADGVPYQMRAFMTWGEDEVLSLAISAFADKLKTAGIALTTYTAPKMPHDAGMFAGMVINTDFFGTGDYANFEPLKIWSETLTWLKTIKGWDGSTIPSSWPTPTCDARCDDSTAIGTASLKSASSVSSDRVQLCGID